MMIHWTLTAHQALKYLFIFSTLFSSLKGENRNLNTKVLHMRNQKLTSINKPVKNLFFELNSQIWQTSSTKKKRGEIREIRAGDLNFVNIQELDDKHHVCSWKIFMICKTLEAPSCLESYSTRNKASKTTIHLKSQRTLGNREQIWS